MDTRNNEHCAACGGACCKSLGCYLSPDDIKGDITYESLSALLDTGIYSIDWYESYEDPLDGDEIKGYFLRMRHVNAPIVDPSWGGVCGILQSDGCPLSYEDRPKGGRMLTCGPDNSCKQLYTKKDCADDWYQYLDILSKLAMDYVGK